MEEKGISVRAMVAGAGLSDKTILRARCSRINECRVYTLEAIAMFLGCKVKDLFEES
jgi:DNA-binding Xre family transcriptional regulator